MTTGQVILFSIELVWYVFLGYCTGSYVAEKFIAWRLRKTRKPNRGITVSIPVDTSLYASEIERIIKQYERAGKADAE